MEEVEDVNMPSWLYPRRWQWDESLELEMSMERLRAMEEWKRRPLKAAPVWPDTCDPAAAAACDYGYDEAALRFYGSGPEAAWPSMENFRFTVIKPCSKKTQENPELRKIGYHGMDGTELGGARRTIWRDTAMRVEEMRAAARHFRPMLRSFTNDDDGVQPTTLSDRWPRNYCSTLLSKLVGHTIRGSAVSVREHGGLTDIEDGLRCIVLGPNVYQHLRGEASSSRTTNTAGTLMEVEDASKCPPLLSTVDQATAGPNCPRCDSSNTKFCYYNNYCLTQPRYFCKGCRRYWTEVGPAGGHRASHRKPQILIDRVSELKNTGYHGMDGTELGEAKEIWSGNPRLPKDAEIRAVVRHFRPMLRSFTNDDDGVQPTTLSDDDVWVQPTTLSDRRFRNYCFTLLSKLVGDTIRGSAGSVREHGGITDIEDGLRYFVRGPNVYQHLRGEASSSRTTNTASTLMGDGRRHNQDTRMKEFRNYAYWITSLSITILVGLLSANKRQPDLLFRSCSSLASGASICGIAMLMLVLIRPSSQSALTCLKTMQYLTIGLLFVAAVLVFTLL